MVILVFCVGSTLPLPVFVVLSGNAVFCRRSGTVAIYKSGVGCSALLSMAPLPVLGVRWPRGRVGVGAPPGGPWGQRGQRLPDAGGGDDGLTTALCVHCSVGSSVLKNPLYLIQSDRLSLSIIYRAIHFDQ